MTSETTPRPHALIKIIRFIIPFIVIAASIAAANYLYATKPVARRGRPQIPPPLVETMGVTRGNHVVTLSAMGTVIPSRSITLKSRVGGFVQSKSKELIPGGIFKKGEVMIRLEQEDYVLNVEKQNAVLAKLKAALRLEMGKQTVAREELKILQKNSKREISNSDLALREPQLAQIKADIAGAQTDLARVKLALERTVIRAPFNCMVMSVNVEPGSQVSTQDTLASLSGIDDYWAKATLPTDQLKWVTIPQKNDTQGSKATVTTQDGTPHPGQVIRLLGELGQDTRLATLLIRIKDPLGLQNKKKSSLLLNSYVQIHIQGKLISRIISLPRSVVRDGDRVWCLDNGQLIIKPVNILWKDTHAVFINGGLGVNDEIIISDIASPVTGMTLGSRKKPPAGAQKKSTPPSLKNNAASPGKEGKK
ncbi:RND family efflux transporter, MFP subunit [Desulfocicer vacuolatum DSM 3385]|uniref:RND family efflux transporter, MFP subunit n=1 Tax=Desulfocicer vacuolatum DSM 3385 TaxID=1121400 RepID=A0A1W2DGN6_9BACT|nr:efflux RND transporter periplasmic adaptor subunit [Desulfocicer vacuolatum]SMC96088.1 RND family efflux transporter, MFP subunit [Desulfocicer vacuolatum DSM 3385]